METMRVTREQLVEALRELVRERGDVVTIHQFAHWTGLGQKPIYRNFPDGWKEFRRAAGLPEKRARKPHFPDFDLLVDYHNVCVTLRKLATLKDYDKHGRFCSATLIQRFGGKQGIKKRYREFLLSLPDRRIQADKSERDRKERREMNLVEFVRERWLELAVRFELSSSDFQAEAQAAERYQLLVCWEHDWPGCPLRVIELRRLLPGKNLTTGGAVAPAEEAA